MTVTIGLSPNPVGNTLESVTKTLGHVMESAEPVHRRSVGVIAHPGGAHLVIPDQGRDRRLRDADLVGIIKVGQQSNVDTMPEAVFELDDPSTYPDPRRFLAALAWPFRAAST